jgi:agarase
MSVRALRTRWGGLVDSTTTSSGFFHAVPIDGVWWLIDPDGGKFLSKGINSVCFDQDHIQNTDRAPYAEACRRKYGSEAAWRTAIARRLLACGFNTLGAWSDELVGRAGPSPLALTPNLDLGETFMEQSRKHGEAMAFPDVFGADFQAHASRRAHELCASWCDDPGIIGWFTDNELRWGADWRGADELLTIFLNRPPASPGRRAAIALLNERYQQVEDFNAVWRTSARSWDELSLADVIAAPYARKAVYERNEAAERASNNADPKRAAFVADCEAFLSRAANRYFAITWEAIKAADPNHMVLGCRFAYVPQATVIDGAAPFIDVISFNCYGFDPVAAIDAYASTGKPCMNTEFSFRGDDSGLPNTIGAAPRVATQAERARCFGDYVSAALRRPPLVGYHWFEHADQPAEGRFDGENSNYGTVTIRDDVYEELARAMTALNTEAEQLHGVPARLAA